MSTHGMSGFAEIGVAVSVSTSTSARRAFSFSLSRTPKAVSSCDDDQAQILEPDLALQQALGRDGRFDVPPAHAREHRLRSLLVGIARAFDANGPVGEPIRERRKMLLCEQGRGTRTATCLPA